MSTKDKFNKLKNKDSFHGLSPVVATVLVVGVVVLLGGLVLFGVLGIFDDPNVSQAGLSFDTTGEGEITIQLISDVRADEIYFKDNDGIVTFFNEDDEEERYVLSEVGDSITIDSNRINGNQLTAIGVIDGEENVLYTQDLSELNTDTGTITGAISPNNAQCNVAGGQTVRLINDDGITVNETETDESGIFVFEGISQGDYTVNFCDNGGSGSGSGSGSGGFLVGGAGHGGGGGASGGGGAGGSLGGAGWVGGGSLSGDSVTVQNPDETSREFCGGEVITEEGTGDISVELKDGDETIAEETDLDSGDSYCFEDISIGQYEITADAPNHISQTNDVKVSSETTTVNNFFLKSEDSDFGTVNVGIITSDSNDSAEVTVKLVDTVEDEVIAEETGGHLDGVYLTDDTITFDEERYRIEASATGYRDYETNTFEIRSDEVELATVFMVQQDTGTVTGVVEDETGSTVSDATIYETSLGQEVTTDSSGQFEVEVLPNEEVEVGAYKDGYTDASTTVTVGENEEESIILQTDQKFGSIEGYVATADNFEEVGEGITIEVTNNDDEVVETTTVTQEDSSFTFDNLLAVDYTVTATDTQYEDSSVTVSVEENETAEIGEIFLENIEFDVVVDNTGDGDAETIDEGINMASNFDNILIVDTGTPYNDFVVDESSDLYIAGEEGQPTVDGDVTVDSNDNEIRSLEITGTLSVNGDNNEFRDIDNNVIISGDNTSYINGNTDTITVENTATDTLIRDVTVNSVTDNGASTVINNNTINAGIELGGSQTTVRENTIQDTQNPVTFTGVEDVDFVENTVTATNSSTALNLENPVGYSSLEATGNTFDGTVIIDGVQTTTKFNSNTFNGDSNAGLELTGTSTDISLVGETVTSTGSSAVIVQNATLTDSSVTLNSIRTTNTVSIDNSTVSDPNFIVQEDNSVTDIGVEVINSNLTSANIGTNGGLPTGVRVEDSSFDTQSLDVSATDTGVMFRGNSDGTVNGDVSATGTDGIAVQYGAEDTTNTIDVTSTIIAQESDIGHQINSSDVTLQGSNKTLAYNNTIGVQLNDNATITDNETVYRENDVGVEVTTTTDILGVDQTSIRTVDNDVGIRITNTAETTIVNMESENDTTGVEVIGDATITDSFFNEETTTGVSVIGGATPTIENNQIFSNTYISSEQAYTVGTNWYGINRADGVDAYQKEQISNSMGENTSFDIWCMDGACEVTSDRPTGDLDLTIKLQPDADIPITGTVGSAPETDGQIDFSAQPNQTVTIEDVWTEDNNIRLDIDGYQSVNAVADVQKNTSSDKTIIVEEIPPTINPQVTLDTSSFSEDVSEFDTATIQVYEAGTNTLVHEQTGTELFEVPSGQYDVYSNVDGFGSKMTTVTVDNQEFRDVSFTHTPNDFGTVEATVVDGTGTSDEPIANEIVYVKSANDHYQITAETDENGVATFSVPANDESYTVGTSAVLSGDDTTYSTQSAQVTVSPSTTETVTLTLADNVLNGTIEMANPSEGVYPNTATINLQRYDSSNGSYTTVSSETVSFDGNTYNYEYLVSQGDYRVEVETDELYTTETTSTKTIQDSGETVTFDPITQKPQIKITGSAFDTSAETKIDALVSIANNNDELSVSTGSDGEYEGTIISENSTHELTAIAQQDGYTQTETTLEVEPASEVQFDFLLSPDPFTFNGDTTPRAIEQGETVEYTATFTNNAQTEQTADIEFREEGSVYDSKNVTVPANSTETVTFNYTAGSDQSQDVLLEYALNGEVQEGFLAEFIVADITGNFTIPTGANGGNITLDINEETTGFDVYDEQVTTSDSFTVGVGEGNYTVEGYSYFDDEEYNSLYDYKTDMQNVSVASSDTNVDVGTLTTQVGYVYTVEMSNADGSQLTIDEGEEPTVALYDTNGDLVESNTGTIENNSTTTQTYSVTVNGLTDTPARLDEITTEVTSPTHKTTTQTVTGNTLPATQTISTDLELFQGQITDISSSKDTVMQTKTFDVTVNIDGQKTTSDDYTLSVGGQDVKTKEISTTKGETTTVTYTVTATESMVGTPTVELNTTGTTNNEELSGSGVVGEITVNALDLNTNVEGISASYTQQGSETGLTYELYENSTGRNTMVDSGSLTLGDTSDIPVSSGNELVIFTDSDTEIGSHIAGSGDRTVTSSSGAEVILSEFDTVDSSAIVVDQDYSSTPDSFESAVRYNSSAGDTILVVNPTESEGTTIEFQDSPNNLTIKYDNSYTTPHNVELDEQTVTFESVTLGTINGSIFGDDTVTITDSTVEKVNGQDGDFTIQNSQVNTVSITENNSVMTITDSTLGTTTTDFNATVDGGAYQDIATLSIQDSQVYNPVINTPDSREYQDIEMTNVNVDGGSFEVNPNDYTQFTVSNSDLADITTVSGTEVDYPNERFRFDLSENWWGTDSPDFNTLISQSHSDYAVTDPYCTAPDCSTLSNTSQTQNFRILAEDSDGTRFFSDNISIELANSTQSGTAGDSFTADAGETITVTASGDTIQTTTQDIYVGAGVDRLSVDITYIKDSTITFTANERTTDISGTLNYRVQNTNTFSTFGEGTMTDGETVSVDVPQGEYDIVVNARTPYDDTTTILNKDGEGSESITIGSNQTVTRTVTVEPITVIGVSDDNSSLQSAVDSYGTEQNGDVFIQSTTTGETVPVSEVDRYEGDTSQIALIFNYNDATNPQDVTGETELTGELILNEYKNINLDSQNVTFTTHPTQDYLIQNYSLSPIDASVSVDQLPSEVAVDDTQQIELTIDGYNDGTAEYDVVEITDTSQTTLKTVTLTSTAGSTTTQTVDYTPTTTGDKTITFIPVSQSDESFEFQTDSTSTTVKETLATAEFVVDPQPVSEYSTDLDVTQSNLTLEYELINTYGHTTFESGSQNTFDPITVPAKGGETYRLLLRVVDTSGDTNRTIGMWEPNFHNEDEDEYTISDNETKDYGTTSIAPKTTVEVSFVDSSGNPVGTETEVVQSVDFTSIRLNSPNGNSVRSAERFTNSNTQGQPVIVEYAPAEGFTSQNATAEFDIISEYYKDISISQDVPVVGYTDLGDITVEPIDLTFTNVDYTNTIENGSQQEVTYTIDGARTSSVDYEFVVTNTDTGETEHSEQRTISISESQQTESFTFTPSSSANYDFSLTPVSDSYDRFDTEIPTTSSFTVIDNIPTGDVIVDSADSENPNTIQDGVNTASDGDTIEIVNTDNSDIYYDVTVDKNVTFTGTVSDGDSPRFRIKDDVNFNVMNKVYTVSVTSSNAHTVNIQNVGTIHRLRVFEDSHTVSVENTQIKQSITHFEGTITMTNVDFDSSNGGIDIDITGRNTLDITDSTVGTTLNIDARDEGSTFSITNSVIEDPSYIGYDSLNDRQTNYQESEFDFTNNYWGSENPDWEFGTEYAVVGNNIFVNPYCVDTECSSTATDTFTYDTTGQVTFSQSGDPVSEATVEVTDGSGTVLDTATTDSNGAYTVTTEYTENATVSISGSNFVDFTVTREVGGTTQNFEAYNSDGYVAPPEDRTTVHNNLAGSGTSADPYQITDLQELQSMSVDKSAHYKLMNNIDATDTVEWNNRAGFDPIGTSDTLFTGSFDGNGYTIDGLTINRTNTDSVGIFGNTENATITSITMTNAEIDGGVRTGVVSGQITTSTVSGVTVVDSSVTGASRSGGMFGQEVDSSITNVELRNVTVTGKEGAALYGGVVGAGFGGTHTDITVDNVTVQNPNDTSNWMGGAFGYLGSTEVTPDTVLEQVTVTDTTVTDGINYVGNIAGMNSGVTVRDSTVSTSSVSGFDDVGGGIGRVSNNGTATNVSVDSTTVNGYDRVGGFAGSVYNSEVTDSSASTTISKMFGGSGDGNFGSFVGYVHQGDDETTVIDTSTVAPSDTFTPVGETSGNITTLNITEESTSE